MPDADRKLTPDELRKRWETPEGIEFRKEIIRQLKSEECKHKVDWKNLEFNAEKNELYEEYKWVEFDGVDELKNNYYSFADLRGINISDENLKKSILRRVCFRYANLEEVILEGAELYRSNFKGAVLIGACLESAKLNGANLDGSILIKANLEGADLRNAKFNEANLKNANLCRADLTNANLNGANLHNAIFDLKTWGMRVEELKSKTNFWPLLVVLYVVLGLYKVYWFVRRLFSKATDKPDLKNATKLVSTQLKNVKLDGDPILYRKLLDEQYLDSFAKEHMKVYPFWLLTSDCGRLVFSLFVWILFIGILFGVVFSDYSSQWLNGFPQLFKDPIQNTLNYFDPKFTYNGQPQSMWWQPFYLSFATMTTLGLASAEPSNDVGFWWHTFQNLFGYVLLGYLIAVLGSKLTRRSA